MRVLIVHSRLAPDAPPDELDTLATAAAIRAALERRGHEALNAPFDTDPTQMSRLVELTRPDLIFNMVESIWGRGSLAPVAIPLLERIGLPMTGCGADAMFASGDKLGAKREMLAAGIPTAAYAEGPEWHGLEEGKCWIVKSVEEDASLGLDSGAVVATPDAVIARAELMAGRHGGRWFAEEFIDGREFNVAVLERKGRPEILPIAEMRFENWREGEPRIVGYAAKWDERVDAFHDTVRSFGWQTEEPLLHGRLVEFAKACWKLFDCRGYARVDFRVDARGQPYVLEINANPCLEPGAGFAAAALEAGLTYDELIECICGAAHGGAASDVPRRAAARGR